jgi:hypothetical protein
MAIDVSPGASQTSVASQASGPSQGSGATQAARDEAKQDDKANIAFVLSATRDLAVLIAGFMVFAGLAYRNYLYVGQFNLPSYMMDASFNTLIFDAYTVLMHNWILVIAAIVGAAVVLSVSWIAAGKIRTPANGTVARAVVILEASVLLIVAFPGLDRLAKSTAQAQALDISSGAQVGSSVHIRPDYAGLPADLLTNTARTTIIDQTDKILFVYYVQPADPSQPNALPNNHVYVVPQAAVDYIDSMPPGGPHR